jgi:plastocyanin
MRKVISTLAAAVVAIGLAVIAGDGASPVQATHGNLNVHVHDNYYHPNGAFVVGPGTDHTLAKAACQKTSPDPECDAVIHEGDTITWVVGAPFAVAPHTVTECTDGTFSACGAAVDPANPIGDSGVLAPAGWPFGPVQFDDPGTYFYRCQIHPSGMRGRIVVQALSVGGSADFLGEERPAASETAADGGDSLTVALGVTLAGVALAGLAAGGWYARRRRAR